MTPDEHTIQELYINVGNGHELYVQEWGNKKVKTPFISFHGGPGGGTSANRTTWFDPSQHRVIFFDQRGCGKSLPYGSLENNTTQNILDDAVKILDRLHIKNVYATGPSWGSCLALAFAIQNPTRVKAVIASDIYLASRAENEWIDNGGFRLFYPDIWEQYLERTPASHRKNPTPYHFKQIFGHDPERALDSAIAVMEMERDLMFLDDRRKPTDRETFDMNSARVYAHYMLNNCFLPDNYIMDNTHKLTMPVWLVQGRYDIVCPPQTAHSLHKAIPHSKLFLTVSNHRAEHETWNVLRAILLQFGGE